jgi:hypothetical protein
MGIDRVTSSQIVYIPNNLTVKSRRVLNLVEKSGNYHFFKIEKYLIHKK